MRRISTLATAAIGLLLACCSSAPTIELVETAPIETTLDHPDVPDACDVWPEMIRGARKTLDIAQFYVSNEPGSRLEPVLREIEAAAARGVRVRILAERKFYKTYPETLDHLATLPGIQFRQTLEGQFGEGILHAKYFVVDGDDVYLGSQNFDWRSLEHIQELGVRVRSPDVGFTIGSTFAADWAVAGLDPSVADAEGALDVSIPLEISISDEYESPLWWNFSGEFVPKGVDSSTPFDAREPPTFRFRGRDVRVTPTLSPMGKGTDEEHWDLARLTALIAAARTSIRVQLLTYKAGADFPDLESALIAAAGRGVKVELLLSDWCKRKSTIGGLQQLARVPGIEIRLVTLPEWSGGFIPFARTIHSKYMAVDGASSWIGTSNWERGYFYESRNVGLIVYGAPFAAALERFFETTWSSPYAARLDPDATYEPPRIGS